MKRISRQRPASQNAPPIAPPKGSQGRRRAAEAHRRERGPKPAHATKYPDCLAETETWTTAKNQVLRLADMDTDHLRNVAGFLMSRRHHLKALEHARRYAGRGLAPWDDEGIQHMLDVEADDFRAIRAADWLAEQPLWLAIAAELMSRKAGPMPVQLDDEATDRDKEKWAYLFVVVRAELEAFRAVEPLWRAHRVAEHAKIDGKDPDEVFAAALAKERGELATENNVLDGDGTAHDIAHSSDLR